MELEKLFAAVSNATPRVTPMPSYDPTIEEWQHIRAITYEGVSIGEQKTKVFAYVGFPKEASATHKVPAVVLVHGGGGHAFAEWIKLWNDRGYAAIAMDNTGHFPSEEGRGVAGREVEEKTFWHYGLYGPFAEEGYTNMPNNDGLSTVSRPIDTQWMYHAVASTIAAHRILALDERVDADKIGIVGVSWGGVITSLAIGYDSYAFAVPIYGSGYLAEGYGWIAPAFAKEPAKALWAAEKRFGGIDFPVLWLCYASDTPFSINANSDSYLATRSADARLGIRVNWGHSHFSGWEIADGYLFADAAIGRRGPLTKIGNLSVARQADGTRCITAPIVRDTAAAAVKATAFYITEPMSYSPHPQWMTAMDQEWQSQPCEVDGDTLSTVLPTEAIGYFLSVTTETEDGNYDVCSPYVQEG
ncbi:MAG: hypothetical protein IJO76_07690 [Clostridia bacterium]|nr:hypothetical protein [Clostridia bacterium]